MHLDPGYIQLLCALDICYSKPDVIEISSCSSPEENTEDDHAIEDVV